MRSVLGTYVLGWDSYGIKCPLASVRSFSGTCRMQRPKKFHQGSGARHILFTEGSQVVLLVALQASTREYCYFRCPYTIGASRFIAGLCAVLY